MPSTRSPDDEAEVVVPAGAFLMGRAEGDLFAREAERPARIVRLSRFAIDVHPVTNRRFRAFLAAGGYDEPEHWTPDGWRWRHEHDIEGPRSLERADLADDLQPVCGLSWYEAQAFCAFAGRRLPTSAEWERAARGLDGRRFPWGDAPLPHPGVCNFDGRVGRPTPIGTYPGGRSPAGIEDAAGNVNDWVEDVFWAGFGRWCVEQGELDDPVLDADLARRLDLDPGQRTDRGGGFLTGFGSFEVLSTTLPLGWPAGSRELWHGFRTARSL